MPSRHVINKSRVHFYRYLSSLRDDGFFDESYCARSLKRNYPSLSMKMAEAITREWMQNHFGIERAMWGNSTETDSDSDDEGSTTSSRSSYYSARSSFSENEDDLEDEDYETLEIPRTCYYENNGKYQEAYKRLLKKYVAPSLRSIPQTPQGNLLRIVTKMYSRYYTDGNPDLSDHLNLLRKFPIPSDVSTDFRKNFSLYVENLGQLERMVDYAVEYALEKDNGGDMEPPRLRARPPRLMI